MVAPPRAILALAAVTGAIALAAGCGSSSSSSADATTTSSPPAATAPAATAPAATAPAAGGSKVAVAADPGGALAFVEKSLAAPAGETTFTFTNDSSVPHNLTFEKAGTEDELGATKTITGASDSITLTLPAGEYTYYCSVPGHEAAGMTGTLTVG